MNKRFATVIRAKLDDSNFALSQDDGPRIRYSVARTIPFDIKAENAELYKRLAIYSNK